MYERFTDRARKVMQRACEEGLRLNHEYLGTEHILLGLIEEGTGVAANVLKNLDIDLRKVRLEVEKIILPGPDKVTWSKLPQTPKVKKVIEYAKEEAKNLNHNYVGTEHLLLGLLREDYNVGAQVLMNLGLKLEYVRNAVLELLGNESGEICVWRTLARCGLKRCRQQGVLPQEEKVSSPEQARIRSLEQHLWNVRVVLGALMGALAGVLLFASLGAAIGLLVGGVVAALGWRSVGILAGAGVGALLGCVHLAGDVGGFAGALLGALVGFLIADIGRSSER